MVDLNSTRLYVLTGGDGIKQERPAFCTAHGRISRMWSEHHAGGGAVSGRALSWADRALSTRLCYQKSYHETCSQNCWGRSRSAASLTASLLASAGLIQYNGSELQILKREDLESVACSCYWVARRQAEKVLEATRFGS